MKKAPNPRAETVERDHGEQKPSVNQYTNISRTNRRGPQHPPDSPLLHPGHDPQTPNSSYLTPSNEETLFSSCQTDSHINDPKLSDCGGGAASAERRRGQVYGWEHGLCALLGICSRTIVARYSEVSVYRRILKGAPTNPQTLGEHLRLARIDRGLKQAEIADLLGAVYQTVEKWEHNLVPMSPKSRARVIAFLGHDPTIPALHPAAGFDES